MVVGVHLKNNYILVMVSVYERVVLYLTGPSVRR